MIMRQERGDLSPQNRKKRNADVPEQRTREATPISVGTRGVTRRAVVDHEDK